MVDNALEQMSARLDRLEGTVETDILLTGNVNGQLWYVQRIVKTTSKCQFLVCYGWNQSVKVAMLYGATWNGDF